MCLNIWTHIILWSFLSCSSDKTSNFHPFWNSWICIYCNFCKQCTVINRFTMYILVSALLMAFINYLCTLVYAVMEGALGIIVQKLQMDRLFIIYIGNSLPGFLESLPGVSLRRNSQILVAQCNIRYLSIASLKLEIFICNLFLFLCYLR